MTNLKQRMLGCAVLTLACILTVGCGGDTGARKNTVSGTVTFDGKPVPKGFITFEPDSKKGNSGPAGGAEIVNGSYKTPSGKGVAGGPYKVKIVGTDGAPTTESGEELPDGKPLFPAYYTDVEFSGEDTTKDFAVPAKEAK